MTFRKRARMLWLCPLQSSRSAHSCERVSGHAGWAYGGVHVGGMRSARSRTKGCLEMVWMTGGSKSTSSMSSRTSSREECRQWSRREVGILLRFGFEPLVEPQASGPGLCKVLNPDPSDSEGSVRSYARIESCVNLVRRSAVRV